MSAEAITYADLVTDAVQTAQFTPEELSRLWLVKTDTKYNVDGSHDSEAFRLEHADLFEENVFGDHIRTYLKEYRLQVQETEIEQWFSNSHIRDAKGKAMVDTGKRCIVDKLRRNRHEDLSKMTADLLCMVELDKLCASAHDGDTIIYASTPDKEYGYTYGFLYVGRVREITQLDKKITLTSIRLDHAKFDNYNDILSDLTHKPISFSTPNQALAHPELVRETLSKPQIYTTLKKYCNFEYNADEKKKNDDIINQMSSRITDYIRFVKSGATLEERITGFQTLEKYVLELKNNYGKGENYNVLWQRETLPVEDRSGDFRGFISQYKKKELPKAVGTCSGKERRSANMYGADSIFDSYDILNEAIDILESLNFGEDSNYCKECQTKNEDKHYHCPKEDGGCGKLYPNETNKIRRTEKCSCGFKFHCGNNTSSEKSSEEEKPGIIVFDVRDMDVPDSSAKDKQTVVIVANNGKRFKIKFYTGSESKLLESDEKI